MSGTFSLQVWAPGAASMEAIAGAEPETLHRDPQRPEWWIGDKTYPPGTRYGFFPPEASGPLPDPRSHSQPDGVHGMSCFVDHDRFAWTDGEWLPCAWESAVIYELHIGTFSEEGTFEGAIPHLEELVKLGVTHVELMPVCEFPGGRGWGYDGVDLFAPHHAYGGPDGLKKLIDASHAAGLAVILDVVYNHLGPDGNYLPRFGPYFSDRHRTPWGDGPNLDGGQSGEVRRFFIDNALMWLGEYRADALRLDAIDKVEDDSPKHFLVELREAVNRLEKRCGKRKILIAESAANDPIYVRPVADGGYGMDALWNDDFHHSLRTLFTRESETYYMDFGKPEQFAKALRQGFVYDGNDSPFRGGTHGKSPAGLPPARFLAYLQTHDQVGNRARGDRFHQHARGGLLEQKIAASFVLLSPYIPMIFMGEEWAADSPFLYFTDHHDPALQKAVSEGRKREFGGSQWEGHVPDPQDMETFLASKLRRDERRAGAHREMWNWYAELLRLRKSIAPALKEGDWRVDANPDGRWIVLDRGGILVAASICREGAELPATEGYSIVMKAGELTKTGNHPKFRGLGVVVCSKR